MRGRETCQAGKQFGKVAVRDSYQQKEKPLSGGSSNPGSQAVEEETLWENMK